MLGSLWIGRAEITPEQFVVGIFFEEENILDACDSFKSTNIWLGVTTLVWTDIELGEEFGESGGRTSRQIRGVCRAGKATIRTRHDDKKDLSKDSRLSEQDRSKCWE